MTQLIIKLTKIFIFNSKDKQIQMSLKKRNQVQDLIDHNLGEQEYNFREKVLQQEEKLKKREQQLLITKQQLEEQQCTSELETRKLKIRDKCLYEKEFIIDQKLREVEQYFDRLKYQLQNLNYYHQQIDKLNSGLQTIIQHELNLI